MCSDCRYPSFRNFDSTISIDVIRMKSYMDSLFDPTCVPVKYMEEFEERAIATATYKPKIWKRYVDDTFTVLGKDYVDGFLQHLNSQQPTIRFTMEIEKDNTIPFLDRSVSRDSNGLLTTTVYRKPTHTD